MPRTAEYRLRDFHQQNIEKFLKELTEVAQSTLAAYGNATVYFEPDPINGMMLVVVADASGDSEPQILEEKYAKAVDAQLEADSLAYLESVYPTKNWVREVPQCTCCSGVAAVDQDGIVHHKGHRQKPYGMSCSFNGTKTKWLDYVASITVCPVCNKTPVVTGSNNIVHDTVYCDVFSGKHQPRTWLRLIEEYWERKEKENE